MLDNALLYFNILWPALLAGLLVLSCHVPFGQEVLKRGIIFLDLAIAQVAALGLILAHSFHIDGENNRLFQQAIALSAAIAGSALLYQFRKLPARIQEALIGIMFMLAATGSILLLAKDPHGGEHLKELLVGQILWVEPVDLISVALVYAAVLFIWFTLRSKLGEWVFYPLFAITITLSTQLVGVYLVFASLIIPALATYQQSNPLPKAYAIGFIAYLSGLIISSAFDFPSGAMIAWALAIIGLIFWVINKSNKLPE